MTTDTSSIDLSTPESKHRTLTAAAAKLRSEAVNVDGEADQFTARAAKLDGLKGMTEHADAARREAERLRVDANTRRGTARAFEEAADQVTASSPS